MASIQKNAQQAKATGDDKRHGLIASRKKVSVYKVISVTATSTCSPANMLPET
jgi:hypothetical protein